MASLDGIDPFCVSFSNMYSKLRFLVTLFGIFESSEEVFLSKIGGCESFRTRNTCCVSSGSCFGWCVVCCSNGVGELDALRLVDFLRGK